MSKRYNLIGEKFGKLTVIEKQQIQIIKGIELFGFVIVIAVNRVLSQHLH